MADELSPSTLAQPVTRSAKAGMVPTSFIIVRSPGADRGEHGGGDAREVKVYPPRPSKVSASEGRKSQPDPVTRTD